NDGTGSIMSGTLTIGLGNGSLALTKMGTSTLTLSGSNTYTGTTTVSGGALELAGQQAWNPALTSTNGTNITSGRAVFNYTGGSSPAGQIETLLTTSYNNNGFNNATSQIRSTTATSAKGLGWVDDGSKVHVAVALYG